MIGIKGKAAVIGIMLLSISLLGGCVSVNITGRGFASVEGSGDIIKNELTLSEYSAVSIKIDAEIIITDRKNDSAAIEMYENFDEYIDIYVKDNTLFIESEPGFSTSWQQAPVIEVSGTGIRNIYAGAMAEIRAASVLQAEELRITIAGHCEFKAEMDVEKLSIDMSGYGDLELTGRADVVKLDARGSGTMNGLGLEAREMKADLSGMVDASIHCTDQLDVYISGMGTMEYAGNPQINQEISGNGSVDQVEAE